MRTTVGAGVVLILSLLTADPVSRAAGLDETRISILERSRCRIALGEPDERSSNWIRTDLLPAAQTKVGTRVPRTEVRALAGETALYLRFDCALEDPARLAQATGKGERVWVEVFPSNDPTIWAKFEADFKGQREASWHRRIFGEKSLGAVPDVWQDAPPSGLSSSPLGNGTSPLDWQLFHGLTREAWYVELVLPWRLLGLRERPATIGLAYGRVFATEKRPDTLETAGWPVANPIFTRGSESQQGEALIGPDAGAPARFQLHPPQFGKNKGTVVLGQQWSRRPATLRVRTEGPDGKSVRNAEFPIGQNRDSVEFDYWLDRSLSSHIDVFACQKVVLELCDGGEVLYTARVPMDRHLGILVDEPYGQVASRGALPSRTVTRRDAWLDRVTRVLPRLHRSTTLQGAPSDFCLMFEDGSLAVNLMADDAWARLTALVEKRFATVEDRLVGAMALVGQKSVTNLILDPLHYKVSGEHQYHSGLHELMGPLSILRYGGGSAIGRAAVLARLLQNVRNPQTGQPFVTRVVSLTEQGGPRQVTRRFAASSNLAPFVQEPGRIGAVAVDYGSSQTLLDPTALAFFVDTSGKLATIETMLRDSEVRADGAGRLAAIYAKIEVEEVQRQKPNRLLSKGVFPELSPNEHEPDKPFDLREVQKLRVITAKKGEESSSHEGFRDTFGERGHRDGAVSLRWDEKELTVRLVVRNVALDALSPRDRQMERVHLVIDPTHGHSHFYHLLASAAGERKLWREQASGIQTLFKNLATENWFEHKELAGEHWSATLKAHGEGYEVVFSVPWQALESEKIPGAVIGLNAWIEGRAPFYEQLIFSPPRRRLPVDPFSFADVYLGEVPVMIRELDLGIPTWGDNTARAVLVNSSEQRVEVALKAENRLGMRRWLTQSPETRVVVPSRGEIAVEFPYFINPEEKMGTGRPQQLRVLAERGGTSFFHGDWSMAYHDPVSVYQRYGRAVGQSHNPKPGEEDFLNKKVRYICSRLPEFRRLTTRDGAASDFVLRAEDGSVEFNLMKPGVLDQIGRYVAGLFDNDLDRILGMYFLSYAPSVGRHNSGGYQIITGAGPLSIIRGNFAGGGGNCGYHATLFAGMAAHLKIDGKPLTTHTVEVWGHAIAAIGWRGSKALIDADVGHFMLTRDASDLATIEQFRSDPSTLCTAGPGDIARYYTFQDDVVRFQGTIRDEDYKGVFPPLGPKY